MPTICGVALVIYVQNPWHITAENMLASKIRGVANTVYKKVSQLVLDRVWFQVATQIHYKLNSVI